MKVGDLIRLSAYGIGRDYNRRITNVDENQLGIIIEFKPNLSYPYKVRWQKTFYGSVLGPSHCRRELKHARR